MITTTQADGAVVTTWNREECVEWVCKNRFAKTTSREQDAKRCDAPQGFKVMATPNGGREVCCTCFSDKSDHVSDAVRGAIA